MIGNVFDVSIDYLLKESVENNEEKEGYYVSREMAEGFLLSTQKTARHIALGFALFTLAFEPYFILGTNSILGILLIIVIATLGIVSFATLGFDQGQYTVLKKEVLLFNSHYFKELTGRYEVFKRKYSVIMVIGVGLLAIGFLAFALEKKLETKVLIAYYPVLVALIDVGLYISLRIITVLSAYKLLVKNDEHTSRFGFKLKQKAKKKIDDF